MSTSSLLIGGYVHVTSVAKFCSSAKSRLVIGVDVSAGGAFSLLVIGDDGRLRGVEAGQCYVCTLMGRFKSADPSGCIYPPCDRGADSDRDSAEVSPDSSSTME